MEQKNILKHLALIMDGNGRWATQRNLNVSAGHKAGADILLETIKLINKKYPDIKHLTVYAMSKENFKRSPQEVNFLLALLEEYLDGDLQEIKKEKIKIKFLGNFSRLSDGLIKKIKQLEEDTKDFDKFSFNICFSYSGREEIVDATKLIIKDIIDNKISIDNLNEDLYKNYLYNSNVPDPDLIIRTGGDLRVSNFLLWEIAYSELFSTPTLWPDFNEKCLDDAIENFNLRKRNYGKRKI